MFGLASQPFWVITLFFVGTGLAITLLIMLMFRKLFPQGIVPDSGIKIFTLVGSGVTSLCGLLFALIVVNVWQNFNQQEERITLEAVELANLYRDSEGINKDSSAKIKALTIDYTKNLVMYGWPAMETGAEGKEVWNSYNLLHATIINYDPANAKEELLYRRMVDHLNMLASYRRLRLLNSNQGNVPVILWGIVVFAGIMSVSFANFFRMGNKLTQTILTSVHAVIISLILMLVFMLNNPYRGPMKLRPYPFEYLVKRVFPQTDSLHATFPEVPDV